jgi:hypothetical protein
MLVGKEFNRDVRGFTLVFEVLHVLFIAAFIHWCRTFDYIDQIPEDIRCADQSPSRSARTFDNII